MTSLNEIRQVIQEIKEKEPDLFCSHPLHILTWKSKKIEGALITKINGQRYLGLQRKDIKGQDYWKYKLLTNKEIEEESPVSQTSSDNIAKFNQRQEKFKDYESKSVNHSE